MDFIVSAATDIGIKKRVNQDSFFAQKFEIGDKKAALIVVCDGISGMEHGEDASRAVTNGFSEWASSELPMLLCSSIGDHIVRKQWSKMINKKSSEIYSGGIKSGCASGTTVTALLLTFERYFLMNVGDTRAYEFFNGTRQLTVDHTVAEEEIRLGNITPEQSKNSPMESMLTRCVGASPEVKADFFFGEVRSGAVYALCCDGFRHCVSETEMYECFMNGNRSTDKLTECEKYLIELNKARGETDNITVAAAAVLP